MKKAKLTAGTAATFLIVGTTAFQAFAADPATVVGMPEGTAVMGSQAYSLTYANDAKNQDQITNLIVNSNNQVYVKDFSGAWINNAGGASMAAKDIPAVTYTDDAGKVTKYGAGDVIAQDTATTVSSVSAITDTKLSVKLSSKVDDAAAANFSIAGVTVKSATLSADKTEAKLDVAGLVVGNKYTVKATGLKVNGTVQPDSTIEFTMPSAMSLFTPDISFADNKTSLKADGTDSVLVTFTLKDSNGNVMADADDVEVSFSTTFGSFAEQTVTAQNGVATVLLKSESLDSAKSALITAQVKNAEDKNLIGLQKQANLLMDPSPDAGKPDSTVGATMTEAQANQADRVIAYFNKPVSVAQYALTGTNSIDPKKASADVYSDVNNDATGGLKKTVAGILPVPGNDKALYILLDTENGQFLTDNTNIKVDFTDKTGSIPVESVKAFKLTDARRPALLSVAREGLKTLTLTFSEPVDAASASNLSNWLIDGVNLSDDAYGVAGSRSVASVGTFNAATGTDTRNVVTVTLGKDASGNQVYFKAGSHSVQGSNVGDWANLTDVGNNVMNTQTLDFDIPVDIEAPVATVDVQSPEQYIVKFNKELNETHPIVTMQKYNKTNGQWENYTTNAVRVTNITPSNAVNTTFKVEVTKDWTDSTVYDTANSHLNYYNDNYRLVVAKDAVTSAANGIKNVEIDMTLGGAMTAPDVVSPGIATNGITAEVDAAGVSTGNYLVKMSEPVKISIDGVNTTDVLPTLAGGQTTLPIVKAQLIKKDNSKTVDANVIADVNDSYDEGLKVIPSTKLDAGDWTLVIRSISDDIGNTAASATQDFTVKSDVTTSDKFAVKWAFADVDTDLTKANLSGSLIGTPAADTDATADYIFVKFNKAVSITGDSINALKTSNYILDGKDLPTGTQIRANVKGYDDKDAVTDSITIVLPDGYLKNHNDNHVLSISSYLQSTTAGDVLTNGGAKKLAWNNDTANNIDLVGDIAQSIVGSSYATVTKDTLGNNIVKVTNTSAKLVDVLKVSTVDIANVASFSIGGTQVYTPGLTADEVKANVATALGKSIDTVTLNDLVNLNITVVTKGINPQAVTYAVTK